MAGSWPSSFFVRVYGPRKSRGHKLAKKERGQYPAILTEHVWPIKDLLVICLSGKFFVWDTVGSPERAR